MKNLQVQSTSILSRKSGRWRQEQHHHRRKSKHKVDHRASREMMSALLPEKTDHNQRHRDSFQGCKSPDVNQDARIDTGLFTQEKKKTRQREHSGKFYWGTMRAVLEQTVIPLKRSREYRKSERKQALELANSLNVRLKRDSKSDNISMLQQGNMEFYSNDNLIYRKMHRSTKET